MYSVVRWWIHLHLDVFDTWSVDSLHRNAVRTDAGEDRTVPHTVPLRRGAMQRNAWASCLWSKIYAFANWRRTSPVVYSFKITYNRLPDNKLLMWRHSINVLLDAVFHKQLDSLFVKKNPTRCNKVTKFLLFLIYVKLNMFRATHRPSSGA